MMQSSVDAVATDHEAGVEIAPHAHSSGQLLLALRGTATITSEHGWWLVPPGLAIWVPPAVVHGARYSESSSIIQVQFGHVFHAALPGVCSTIVVSDLLRELAREAVRLRAIDDEVETLALLARLMVLQARRPRQGPGLFIPRGSDRRLQQATDFLRRNPGSSIRLTQLAARVNTSSRTLERLFMAETNMNFGRWREHLRVVCAVDSLAQGQSITQTALQLGYRSASSFTTLFTRLLGAPPRRYMQQLRHGAWADPPPAVKRSRPAKT